MHGREQIRNAFVLALGSLTPTIYNARIFPLYDAVIPAINVFAREEAIPDENNQGRLSKIQNRTLLVTVQGSQKTDDSLDNDLDDLAEQIETVIFADADINRLVRCLDLISTELENSKDGEQEIGIITLIFSCRYMTNDGEPGVII